MANFKYKGNKKTRSGCLLCKPNKMPGVHKAERARDKEAAFKHEEKADEYTFEFRLKPFWEYYE